MQIGVGVMGLFVGFVVGLTGMGGGALMTPLLVLVFHVQPLAAVSSDLVAAVIMKPVGGAVHVRRGKVHLPMVRWLVLGSVPSAFAGVVLLRLLGEGGEVQDTLKIVLGVALLVAAASMAAKTAVDRGRPQPDTTELPPVRRLPTVAVGAIGGLVVGMTSVGSGSLMIVLLLLLYPSLSARSLVGTDLVQAVPLVLSAAAGHLLFGDFKLGLTVSLLVGSVPGVYLGARLSARAESPWIRPVLIVVLVASALKLLGAPTGAVAAFLAVTVVAGAVVALRARQAGPQGASVGEADRQQRDVVLAPAMAEHGGEDVVAEGPDADADGRVVDRSAQLG